MSNLKNLKFINACAKYVRSLSTSNNFVKNNKNN